MFEFPLGLVGRELEAKGVWNEPEMYVKYKNLTFLRFY